ncbi:S1 family peptidase [Variovorax sp. HJSM1_2]|uniref:S1 family peptidase n=1 Tax=Variovorax sp. HJSM1_2 TaxID=3366263 RepID=UPI003BE0C22D
MRRALIFGGAAALALRLSGKAGAQPAAQASDILAGANASVVKIDAGTYTASGFLWPDTQHVVTALHVVDSAQNVVGHWVDAQGRIEASHPLLVERLLKSADLVLLRLPKPLARPALQLNTSLPQVKQTMDALGFAMNSPGASATEVKRRFGGDRLSAILPPKVLATLTDYPSASLEILNLEGNLVPGLSGAPLLDNRGRVVGVANGGLEEGAVGICWGIPAKHLEQLALSNTTELPRAQAVKLRFAADLQPNVKTLPALNGVTLTRLRSRSFAQLAASADDQLGLRQLANVFQAFQPEHFQYDIYQDLQLGATLAVPQGATLRTQGEFIGVQGPGWPRMSMLVQIRPVADAADTQRQAELFERLVTEMDTPGTQVALDPAWSYLAPMQKGALRVSRKGAYRARFKDGMLQRDAYFFGTVATNGRAFLGVVAINKDDSMPTNVLEVQCAQGLGHQRCPSLVGERRAWAQMVLAAQFSTFPAA